MSRILLRSALGLALLVAAARPAAAQTSSTPREVVEKFFKATSDTNLKVMGTLWGTAKGPAATTGVPEDWERRLIVMGTFLRGTTTRALADVQGKDAKLRIVTTELSRGACKVVLAVTVVQSPVGWLVNAFDLGEAGNVNRVCDRSGGGNFPPH